MGRNAEPAPQEPGEPLRILVADGRGERLDEVKATVTGLGHQVVGEASLDDVAALTASLRPDAAIVIVGESTEHALGLIGRIVTEAACPVIAILDVEDEAFIHEAARRGIFAYVTQARGPAALQSSLDVVLARFAEYHGLEGAFARRAIMERAKGILMERHGIDEKKAFSMLRDEARRTNRKVTDVADAVTLSVALLRPFERRGAGLAGGGRGTVPPGAAGRPAEPVGTLGDRMDKVGPRHRMCRRVGQPLCGRPNCPAVKRPYPPGQHGRGRKRFSEYQVRLLEKQKLRAIYGVSERQMRVVLRQGEPEEGVTGEELIRQLETRLDAVILHLGFALTQRQARQLVSHGHVKLDGKRIDVPSAQVKPEQTIELSDKAKNFVYVREALELAPDPPPYLYRNVDQLQGTLSRLPERDEIPLPVPIEERLIIEYYS